MTRIVLSGFVLTCLLVGCRIVEVPEQIEAEVKQYEADRDVNEELATRLKMRFEESELIDERDAYTQLVADWNEWRTQVRTAIQKGSKRLTDESKYEATAESVGVSQRMFREKARNKLEISIDEDAFDFSHYGQLGISILESILRNVAERQRNQIAQEVYSRAELKQWSKVAPLVE